MPWQAVIFDFDGTLCDVRETKYLSDIDIDEFHSRTVDCPPTPVVEIAKSLPFDKIVVTSRENRYRTVTKQWLVDNGLGDAILFMRPDGDRRSAYEVKSEIYDQLIKPYLEIRGAWDDDPHSAMVWMDRGIRTHLVKGYGWF